MKSLAVPFIRISGRLVSRATFHFVQPDITICHVFVNRPNWIPRGAKAEVRVTTEQPGHFDVNTASGIIWLDEVNKMTGDHFDCLPLFSKGDD